MGNAEVTVRSARTEDGGAIARIYTHYALHTVATFDTQPLLADAWTERFGREVEDGPHLALVAVGTGGEVRGFAQTSEFRARPAYGTSVSVAVYCAPDCTGAGVGSRLYTALFPLLEASDFHRAYAGITMPNPASVALHEKFGFVHRGTFTECGFKHGRYLDVAWYERPLSATG